MQTCKIMMMAVSYRFGAERNGIYDKIDTRKFKCAIIYGRHFLIKKWWRVT